MDALPNELLLDIFEYLDYDELKYGVPATCKRFASLIAYNKHSGILASKLFLEKHTVGNPVSEIVVHPIFSHLRHRFQDPKDDYLKGCVYVEVPSKTITTDHYQTFLDAFQQDLQTNILLHRKAAMDSITITENTTSPISETFRIDMTEILSCIEGIPPSVSEHFVTTSYHDDVLRPDRILEKIYNGVAAVAVLMAHSILVREDIVVDETVTEGADDVPRSSFNFEYTFRGVKKVEVKEGIPMLHIDINLHELKHLERR